MSNDKMSSRLPRHKSLQDFILGAETKHKINSLPDTKQIFFPWESVNLRDDIKKAFNLQLPEEYILKIKFLSEYTNKSQQKIVRETVCNGIDEAIKNIRKENNLY